MTRRLLVSGSSEERLAAALSWLEEVAPRRELLVVAPTWGAADDFLRSAASQDRGMFGIHRATPRQLAYELGSLGLAGEGRRPLSGLSLLALATRCVHQAQSRGELEYFAPVAAMPGFPEALARTLEELRLEGVVAEELASRSPANRDLATLLAGFEREMEHWRLVDGAGVLSAAVQRMETAPHRLLGLPLVLLDIEVGSGCEERFLAGLCAKAPAVFACLPAASDAGEERLRRALGQEVHEIDASPPSTGSALARARAHLFGVHSPARECDVGEDDDSLELFSAAGEDRECVEIVRRIQKFARSGVSFDSMAVLLRQPESYLPLLQDAMRRGGVPTYTSRGASRPDPSGRAFLALLSCASEGLSASRFAEYLSLGEIPTLDATGAPERAEVAWVEAGGDQLVFKSPPPSEGDDWEASGGESIPTPALWERMLLDAAVVGGRDRWSRRLAGLRNELQLRLRDVEGEEEPRRLHLSRQLQRLQGLERFALPVIEALAALPAEATWGEWIQQLEALSSLVLPDPARLLQLLAELRPMAEVASVPLDQVREVLRQRLSFLQRDPPRRRYGRVFVGTIEEAAGRSFGSVFLPGLAEGVFPRKPFEDPLLLDRDRRALPASLEVQDQRFLAERSLLRAALGAASVRLVASYPRIDLMAGRARVPSFYALDLLRAAHGSLPDLRRLDLAAARTHLGWPAPADPEDAVDEAEYDLSVLAGLLRSGEGDHRVKGQARFLFANPHLERSLRARAGRWRSRWVPADGLIAPAPAALELLRAELPENRSYSPTALQSYAACPYRFLLYAVHKLRPREDLVSPERLDPLTRGSLFHETQFRFFGEAKDLGLLPLRADHEAEILDVADRVLNEVASGYEEELAPAIPHVWKSEIEGLRTDFRGWIRRLLEEEGSWTPAHFEFAFGLAPSSDRDTASTSEEALVLGGAARLRGSIDLVERDWRRRAIRVTDHKTGRPPKQKSLVVGGGEILQPVLYALAAEALLAGEGEQVESGRLFYSTQRGGYNTIEVPLNADSRAAAAEVIGVVEQSVLDGFFPAAPGSGACQYCDYRSVCGPYEEIRLGRKKKDRLARLEALRKRA